MPSNAWTPVQDSEASKTPVKLENKAGSRSIELMVRALLHGIRAPTPLRPCLRMARGRSYPAQGVKVTDRAFVTFDVTAQGPDGSRYQS